MKNLIKFSFCAAAALIAGSAFADPGSDAYRPSSIDARLNVTVRPDTDTVYFVRDNADPDVITKTYVLKHADPYEIRAFLRTMVRPRRIDENDTGVQALKFNDGTGVIMISAEEVRFEDTAEGMGFDSIMKELDTPKMRASSGSSYFVYSPLYRNAAELEDMLGKVGANTVWTAEDSEGNETLLNDGIDKIKTDPGLNLLFFNTSCFSRAAIDKMLKQYDQPYGEVHAKITVYELYAENDTKLGLDFRAWKNNDGIDLFNTGARFMDTFNSTGEKLIQGSGWSDTTYLNFNPKWNTKYIDFLTTKGKARVLTTSEVAIRSGVSAEIQRYTQVFLAKTEKADDLTYTERGGQDLNYSVEDFNDLGLTRKGKTVTVIPDDKDATTFKLNVTKVGLDDNYNYSLRSKNARFFIDGKDFGRRIRLKAIGDLADLVTEENDVVSGRGNKINTLPSDTFGFNMTLTPFVSADATILNVNITNTSLIGYTSEGNPRIQQGAAVDSQFMISNKGTKLVIGGIEKRDVVRVSGGIPLLKDLPVLGWIFSTESESTKKSQLVVVAEVIPSTMDETMNQQTKQQIDGLNSDLKKAGESNSYGYRQLFLDPDRLK